MHEHRRFHWEFAETMEGCEKTITKCSASVVKNNVQISSDVASSKQNKITCHVWNFDEPVQRLQWTPVLHATVFTLA